MRTIDIIMAKRFGKGKKGMVIGWPWMMGTAGGGGTETTVTGVSPLLLAAALKKPIKSLTQYGLCTQADTPTPSAPVPIMCNNGAVQMVDDELPAGYKRVLGFSMSNNSYWAIEDFPLYGSDTLRFAFEASDACNVIGAYSGSASGNNYSLYVGSSSNYLRYKNGAYNSAVDFNTRYDVEITPTGSSGMKTDSTWTEQSFTTPANLCIGTTATSASSAKLKGKLYGNIEVVGRAKFVPCERVSDNVLGYYDLIGEAFYEQASGYSGAVSLGYDGTHYHLAVIGTPEVLSVTASGAATQTASVVDLFSVGGYADEHNVISGAITRKVGVKVFDGTEDGWGKLSSINGYYITVDGMKVCNPTEEGFSSHFLGTTNSNVRMPDGSIKYTYASASDPYGAISFRLNSAETVDEWKAFLADQYAAGTPVIVLYPLKEETTEQTAPQSLHTTAGDNVISVTAAVSPIELEAIYMKGE